MTESETIYDIHTSDEAKAIAAVFEIPAIAIWELSRASLGPVSHLALRRLQNLTTMASDLGDLR
jgi:hypothetical protein